ncbi:hypothetical protein LPJ53_005738 [Coemansia erecta]|uniref:AA9 family lytic polysaccharide monooxygenase n=1 Tax=Coemansia erecta TaxID=147472 RepID=A0A9W7XW44_9FUNG|nr:hypothetical protein LPJ53_005738 [Coemansia erecta]
MQILPSILLAFALTANAHTHLSNIWVNGTRQDPGHCIRPYGVSTRNSPVQDLSSDDLRCRTTSMDPSDTDTCGVVAGTNVTAEWHKSDGTGTVISSSHKGPCLVYMSKMDSEGVGNVWFKIYEDGYDPDTDTWCTDKLIKNGGKLDVTIPVDIEPGNYLMRTELIALHNAGSGASSTGSQTGAQLYPNCAQLYVSGEGSADPTGVAIPGVYKPTDPGLDINIYKDFKSYTIPGPDVYEPGSD